MGTITLYQQTHSNVTFSTSGVELTEDEQAEIYERVKSGEYHINTENMRVCKMVSTNPLEMEDICQIDIVDTFDSETELLHDN